MGVVARRYIDFLIILLIPTPLVLALFLQQHPYFIPHFIKVKKEVLVYVIFVQYSKICSDNIPDHSKFEITQTWRYNYIDKNVRRPRVPRLPSARYQLLLSDISQKLQLTLCTIMES